MFRLLVTGNLASVLILLSVSDGLYEMDRWMNGWMNVQANILLI